MQEDNRADEVMQRLRGLLRKDKNWQEILRSQSTDQFDNAVCSVMS